MWLMRLPAALMALAVTAVLVLSGCATPKPGARPGPGGMVHPQPGVTASAKAAGKSEVKPGQKIPKILECTTNGKRSGVKVARLMVEFQRTTNGWMYTVKQVLDRPYNPATEALVAVGTGSFLPDPTAPHVEPGRNRTEVIRVNQLKRGLPEDLSLRFVLRERKKDGKQICATEEIVLSKLRR
jgi:hypothetical protein